MADVYSDCLDELRQRIQHGITDGKLLNIVKAVYIGAQPESKFENDSLPAIVILDGGFEEIDHSACASQVNSNYTVIIRLMVQVFQNAKESSNNLYYSGATLPAILPVNIGDLGLVNIRSKVIDTVFTNTSDEARGQFRSGVKSVSVTGDAPILDNNKYYQDIKLVINTGLFGINQRNT